MADDERVPAAGRGKPGGGQAGQAGAATQQKRDPLTEALRRFEDAHLNYLREVRDVWAEAQRKYQHACQRAAQQLEHALSDPATQRDPAAQQKAYHEQAEQVQKAVSPDELKKQFEEAYRNHLRALKDAWANLDVDAIDLGSNS
jgi:hypothetical protein